MQPAQSLAGAITQFRKLALGLILQPAGFAGQIVLRPGGMRIPGIALLQGDNLHVITHINKRGDLVQDEGFGRKRKFQ
ncbi:hypothetical protein D3C75_447950 [compost metagenome]